MPFVLRQVTPIALCNRPISGTVDDELQAISNQALCGILRQLSSLVLHADGILGELMVQFERLSVRTEAIHTRVQTLKLNCDGLDARSALVPESDLTTFSRQKFQPILSTTETTSLFTEQTRPPALQKLYSACQLNPVVTLRHLDPFRRDGMRSSRLFKCTPIMEKDSSASLLDIETRTPEELDLLPEWIPPSDILHPVHPDVRCNKPNSSNQPLLRKLPTPSQLSVARSRMSRAELVPTDTSGKTFQRLVQFRRSLSQISYTKQKHRRKSRKPRQKLDDSENMTAESTEKSFETDVLLKCDTPTSTDSTNGNASANTKTRPGRSCRSRGDTDSGRGSRTSHRASSDPDSARHRVTASLTGTPHHRVISSHGEPLGPAEDTDDASSAFSCDAEGYYTSFHCDSGVKLIDTNGDQIHARGDGAGGDGKKKSTRKTPPPLPPLRSETTFLSSAIEKLSCHEEVHTPEPATDDTFPSEGNDNEHTDHVTSVDNEEICDDTALDVATPLSRRHGNPSDDRQNKENNIFLTPSSSTNRPGKFDSTTSCSIEHSVDRTPRSKQLQHSLSMVSSGLKRRVSRRFFPREQETPIGNIVTKSELDKLHSGCVDFNLFSQSKPDEDTQLVVECDSVPISVYELNSAVINRRMISSALRFLLFASVTLPFENWQSSIIPFADRKYRKRLLERELKRITDGTQLTYETICQHYRCKKRAVSSFEPGKYVRQISLKPMFERALITPRRPAHLASERPMHPIPLYSDQESNVDGSSSDSVASEGAPRPLHLLNGIEHYYCRENCCKHLCHYNGGGECLEQSAPLSSQLQSSATGLTCARPRHEAEKPSSGSDIGHTNSCPDLMHPNALRCKLNVKRWLDMIRLAKSSHFTDDAYFSQDTIIESVDGSEFVSWSQPCLYKSAGKTIPTHAPYDFAASRPESLCSILLDDVINHYDIQEDIPQASDCRMNGEGVVSSEELYQVVLELNKRLTDNNSTLAIVENESRIVDNRINPKFRGYDHSLSHQNVTLSLDVSESRFSVSFQSVSSDYQRCSSLPNISRECDKFPQNGHQSRVHTLPNLTAPLASSSASPIMLLQYTPSPEYTARDTSTSRPPVDSYDKSGDDINGNIAGGVSGHGHALVTSEASSGIPPAITLHTTNPLLRRISQTNLDEIDEEAIMFGGDDNSLSQNGSTIDTKMKHTTKDENSANSANINTDIYSSRCDLYVEVNNSSGNLSDQYGSNRSISASLTTCTKISKTVIKRNNSYRLGVNNGEQ